MRRMLFIVSMCAMALSACAGMREDSARDDMNAKIAGLNGLTKEEVVLNLGPPDSKTTEGRIEVWSYRKSLGYRTRGNAFAPNRNALGQPTFYRNETYEKYNSMVLYFIDGKLAKWDVDAKR